MAPLATSMATSMATDMQPVAPPLDNFRFAVAGAQAAVYLEDDQGNAVLADGDTTVQALTDVIPNALKAVPEAQYVVTAASPTGRPTLAANGGLTFNGVAHVLDQATSPLAAHVTAGTPHTIYLVASRGNANGSSHDVLVGFSSESVTTEWEWVFADNNNNTLLVTNYAHGGTGVAAAHGTIPYDGSPWVAASALGSSLRNVYLRGDPGPGDGAAYAAPTVGNFAIGAAVRQGSPLLYGGMIFWEVFICLEKHDAATVRAVSAELVKWWDARGVPFLSEDFRLSVEGAQAALYRAEDDSNAVLADTDTTVQTLVDMVPPYLKAVIEDAYIVDATGAASRPGAGADGACNYVAADSDAMVKAPSPLAQAMAGRADVTVYFVWGPDGPNQGAFTIAEGSAAYWSAWGVSGGSINVLGRRNGLGPNGPRADNSGAVTIDALVYDAANGALYSDGALSVAAAVGTIPANPTRLALGMLSRTSGELQYFLNGPLYEVFVCFAAHDAATVQDVSNKLRDYWIARGAINWRDAYAFNHDWRADDLSASVLAGADLQTWGDVIGSATVDAPGTSQRLVPDADGWQSVAANQAMLWTDAEAALFALFANNNPFTLHVRVKLPLDQPFARYLSATASSTNMVTGIVRSAGDFEFQRRNTDIADTGPGVLVAGTYTLSGRYDPSDAGAELRAYIDGVHVASETSTAANLAALWFLIGAHTTDGVTMLNHTNATYYEIVVKGVAQSDADILEIHNRLAADWP